MLLNLFLRSLRDCVTWKIIADVKSGNNFCSNVLCFYRSHECVSVSPGKTEGERS